MNASVFFKRPFTTKTIYNVGAGTNDGLAPMAFSGQGLSIGQSTTDDNYKTLISISDKYGYINMLWFASATGLYTSSDVFTIRLTIDGSVVATSQVTIDADDKGAIIVGGCTNDGTDNRPLACGFVPFRNSFLIEQKVVRAGAGATPSVYVSYVFLGDS